MSERGRLAGSVLCLLLSGCLAPKYARPDAPVADAFPESPAGFAAAPEGDEAASAVGWRDYFVDPDLIATVEAALEHNRDLRIALLRVDRARAAYGVRLWDFAPDVNAEASATASRQVFGPGLAVEGTVYRGGLSIPAYELDLFGRMRYASISAQQQHLATVEGARAARVALIAAVANAWVNERSLAAQHQLASRSLAARQEQHALVVSRYEVGLSSEIALQQSASLVASAEAAEAALARGQARAQDALVQLVGAPVDALPAVPLASLRVPVSPPPGIPSEVLAARPDVLAAERRLMAAHADIGAARAAYFPRITLTASRGSASSELGALFGAGAGVWSFVPAVSQPIFGLPQTAATVRATKVDRQILVAEYEKAIQVAFREVSDALVSQGPLDAQVAAATRQRDAEAARRELARARHAEGLASFSEVLDAERASLDAERALEDAQAARLQNAVALYAALGGGAEE